MDNPIRCYDIALTCTKQTMRFVDTDHVICFNELYGLFGTRLRYLVAPYTEFIQKCTITAHPIHHHSRQRALVCWRKILLYAPTPNDSEGVGNEITMDNSTLNSHRSAHSSSSKSITIRDHVSWDAEKKLLLRVPTLDARKVLEMEKQWTIVYWIHTFFLSINWRLWDFYFAKLSTNYVLVVFKAKTVQNSTIKS